jgi:general stress protein 26
MDVSSRVREMLAAHPYGFLITAGDASPHARLVQHVAVDADLSIWIGTSPKSRKAEEVVRSGTALYSVEDRASFAAAVLSGPASIEVDPSVREARWVSGFEAFFPSGPDGDDFVLIHLVPNEIELIDFTHGVHPDPYGLVSQHFSLVPSGWIEQ